MVSKYFTIILECCLALLGSASIVKRSYQDYPLQMCPQDVVCSEIYSLSSQGLGPAAYMLQFKCKCPTGSECPAVPGSQTINTDVDKWYGFCQPVEDIPMCKRNDVAQQVVESEINGQSYTKVHCVCPSHALTEANVDTLWPAANQGSSEAKYVRNLVCRDDAMSKRNDHYGGRNRSRGRFYFYRK